MVRNNSTCATVLSVSGTKTTSKALPFPPQLCGQPGAPGPALWHSTTVPEARRTRLSHRHCMGHRG